MPNDSTKYNPGRPVDSTHPAASKFPSYDERMRVKQQYDLQNIDLTDTVPGKGMTYGDYVTGTSPKAPKK